LLVALDADYETVYHIPDYRGKRVVDVGGFIGETALFFWKWGAEKVLSSNHYLKM